MKECRKETACAAVRPNGSFSCFMAQPIHNVSVFTIGNTLTDTWKGVFLPFLYVIYTHVLLRSAAWEHPCVQDDTASVHDGTWLSQQVLRVQQIPSMVYRKLEKMWNHS